MKILLTGGKSAVALKLLKAFTNYSVVLADYGDVPLFASKDYQFISLGIKNEDILAHNLLNYCLNEGLTTILPLHSFEVEALAKAKILFSEFNIEVLLPNLNDLNQYFKPGMKNKSDDWAVFNDGKLIFSTKENEETKNQAGNHKLNGAFYVHPNNEFTLLTI